jgi:hypothetical protein
MLGCNDGETRTAASERVRSPDSPMTAFPSPPRHGARHRRSSSGARRMNPRSQVQSLPLPDTPRIVAHPGMALDSVYGLGNRLISTPVLLGGMTALASARARCHRVSDSYPTCRGIRSPRMPHSLPFSLPLAQFGWRLPRWRRRGFRRSFRFLQPRSVPLLVRAGLSARRSQPCSLWPAAIPLVAARLRRITRKTFEPNVSARNRALAHRR